MESNHLIVQECTHATGTLPPLVSETKESNLLLRPGRSMCYRYTNLAYIITDENTHVNEPAFVGLLFPNFSTIFWIVPIQCGLVMLTTHKVTNYSLFTPLLLLCRTDSHLRCQKFFERITDLLRRYRGKEQLPTMYAPFVCNWRTLLLFLFKICVKCKMSFGLQMFSSSGSPTCFVIF